MKTIIFFPIILILFSCSSSSIKRYNGEYYVSYEDENIRLYIFDLSALEDIDYLIKNGVIKLKDIIDTLGFELIDTNYLISSENYLSFDDDCNNYNGFKIISYVLRIANKTDFEESKLLLAYLFKCAFLCYEDNLHCFSVMIEVGKDYSYKGYDLSTAILREIKFLHIEM